MEVRLCLLFSTVLTLAVEISNNTNTNPTHNVKQQELLSRFISYMSTTAKRYKTSVQQSRMSSFRENRDY